MIIMGAVDAIIKMAKENNGTVTNAMVVAAGFSRGNINYLVDKGFCRYEPADPGALHPAVAFFPSFLCLYFCGLQHAYNSEKGLQGAGFRCIL